jgi:hypothetical protein
MIVTAMPEPAQPTHTPSNQITSIVTTLPTIVATIDVPANQENGVTYHCEKSGQYTIIVEGGSYSTWRDGLGPNGGQWRTKLYVYANRSVVWGKTSFGFMEPSSTGDNQTTSVGKLELPNGTRATAETAGKGQMTTINCNSGQYLRFVAVDQQATYGDNIGKMQLSIGYTPT